MTLREKIADWISGGLLSKALWALDVNRKIAKSYIDMRDESIETLQKIAAQETPSANATVRRMARIAREGLGE